MNSFRKKAAANKKRSAYSVRESQRANRSEETIDEKLPIKKSALLKGLTNESFVPINMQEPGLLASAC